MFNYIGSNYRIEGKKIFGKYWEVFVYVFCRDKL